MNVMIFSDRVLILEELSEPTSRVFASSGQGPADPQRHCRTVGGRAQFFESVIEHDLSRPPSSQGLSAAIHCSRNRRSGAIRWSGGSAKRMLLERERACEKLGLETEASHGSMPKRASTSASCMWNRRWRVWLGSTGGTDQSH